MFEVKGEGMDGVGGGEERRMVEEETDWVGKLINNNKQKEMLILSLLSLFYTSLLSSRTTKVQEKTVLKSPYRRPFACVGSLNDITSHSVIEASIDIVMLDSVVRNQHFKSFYFLLFLFLVFIFERRSYHIAQIGLKLTL